MEKLVLAFFIHAGMKEDEASRQTG
jgi:hypothetical protein